MTDTKKRLISLFTQAHSLGRISVYLGYAAILVFCVFGTLSSLSMFRQNTLIYWAFHYLPYLLITLGVPISLYQAFLLHRYRVIQFYILAIVLLTGFLLPIVGLGFWLNGLVVGAFMIWFLAMIAWFAVPFLFRVNIRRYLQFLNDQESP